MSFSELKSGHWFSQEKQKCLLSCSVICSVILCEQEKKRGGEERHWIAYTTWFKKTWVANIFCSNGTILYFLKALLSSFKMNVHAFLHHSYNRRYNSFLWTLLDWAKFRAKGSYDRIFDSGLPQNDFLTTGTYRCVISGTQWTPGGEHLDAHRPHTLPHADCYRERKAWAIQHLHRYGWWSRVYENHYNSAHRNDRDVFDRSFWSLIKELSYGVKSFLNRLINKDFISNPRFFINQVVKWSVWAAEIHYKDARNL